eukprot:m.369146 g.369146  ORF g.369146 m.369146 type:complete len:277 (+) comp48395_c0_seq1:157-987(+)
MDTQLDASSEGEELVAVDIEQVDHDNLNDEDECTSMAASVIEDITGVAELLCTNFKGRGVCGCIHFGNVKKFEQLHVDFKKLRKGERTSALKMLVTCCVEPSCASDLCDGTTSTRSTSKWQLLGTPVCRERFTHILCTSRRTITNLIRKMGVGYVPHVVQATIASKGAKRSSPIITIHTITAIADTEGLEFPDKRGRVRDGRPSVHLRMSRKYLYRLYQAIFPETVQILLSLEHIKGPAEAHTAVKYDTFRRTLKKRCPWLKLSFARTDDCDTCAR